MMYNEWQCPFWVNDVIKTKKSINKCINKSFNQSIMYSIDTHSLIFTTGVHLQSHCKQLILSEMLPTDIPSIPHPLGSAICVFYKFKLLFTLKQCNCHAVCQIVCLVMGQEHLVLTIHLCEIIEAIRRDNNWGPFYWCHLTLNPTWICNHIANKVWDEIIYPFSNFSGGAVEVWELIDVITYPCQ